jgi:hypothetical protein
MPCQVWVGGAFRGAMKGVGASHRGLVGAYGVLSLGGPRDGGKWSYARGSIADASNVDDLWEIEDADATVA